MFSIKITLECCLPVVPSPTRCKSVSICVFCWESDALLLAQGAALLQQPRLVVLTEHFHVTSAQTKSHTLTDQNSNCLLSQKLEGK